MAEIIQLPLRRALRTPIGHAIRTGDTSYQRLEHLHAEGRLPARAVIVDASKAKFQREFMRALRENGSDVTLDTKVAELSEIGKFKGSAKGTPWAAEDENRPLRPEDFEAGANLDIFGKIARSAVELDVTSVMSPTHFLRPGVDSTRFPIDCRSVSLLRTALDREGGRHIVIDYPLILPHTCLFDVEQRTRIVSELYDLPIDNLVLRLSGFGADAGPFTVKKILRAIQKLHDLGYPILLDYVGGLVGLSALAFGVVSGIANGIGERDRFDARRWQMQPEKPSSNGPFGRTVYFPLPDFDKSFRKEDLEAIANTPRGQRLVACEDRDCCPQGLTSMLNNHRSHIARQKIRAVDDLFNVPDSRRIDHFMSVEMRNAERKARDLVRLKVGDDRLKQILSKGRKRIESMTRMFETLSERDRPFPPALKIRLDLRVPTQGSLV